MRSIWNGAWRKTRALPKRVCAVNWKKKEKKKRTTKGLLRLGAGHIVGAQYFLNEDMGNLVSGGGGGGGETPLD